MTMYFLDFSLEVYRQMSPILLFSHLYFAEEALLLGHHITHKSPGSSKKMYAHSLEEVSTEYGRVCDIKGPVLYARDSKNLVLTEGTNKCNIIYYCRKRMGNLST